MKQRGKRCVSSQRMGGMGYRIKEQDTQRKSKPRKGATRELDNNKIKREKKMKQNKTVKDINTHGHKPQNVVYTDFAFEKATWKISMK